MSDAILLDTGPLGILANHPKKPTVAACLQWLANCRKAGSVIYLPEIADYEVRRELLRAGLTGGIARLDGLKAALVYLPITTEAMLLAAELWAQSRQGGQATSDPHALDGDVILVAQMLSLGLREDAIIAATTNPKHLVRFVRCAEWTNIVP